MIPILYSSDETAFTSNGLGRLKDCISCLVTEERNGLFEVEFEYPITGVYYSEIREGRIISVTHDDTKTRQAFRIYRRSAPMNGIVTFNARHICYGLANVIVQPFTAPTCAAALNGFSTNALTDCPYVFWTDKTASGSFNVRVPSSVWDLLGGSKGSILDVYGTGEWMFDNWTAKLYLHRGTDSGVTIRYGKNLTDIEHIIEDDGTYNAIVPYWTDGTVTVVGNVIHSPNATPELVGWTTNQGARVTVDTDDGEWIEFALLQLKAVPYDFSSYFEEEPSVTQLNNQALTYLNANTPWIPKENITVDFIALWQTTEYADYAELQRVKLCDTVTILYPGLGVNATAKVIRVVYNVLLDRYDEIEVGDAKTSYGDLIKQEAVGEVTSLIEGEDEDVQALIDAAIAHSQSVIEGEIEHATDLITGGLGGHVVIKTDANGKPQEILIMDTESELTAVNVLRINVNGIGFSSNGVSGPYSSAWTLDGHFVADFIATGNLNASLITTGVLNATLIKTGILDGLYFQCVNLVATNATVTGIFKAMANSTNYIQIDSGAFNLYTNGHLSTLIHNIYENGAYDGSEIVLYDGNGTMRTKLFTKDSANGSGLNFYDSTGILTVAIQDGGIWYYDPNLTSRPVARLTSSSYGAMWRLNSTSSSFKYSILQENGIWFYDPAQLDAGYNGIISMWTADNGFYHMRDLVIGGTTTLYNLDVSGRKNRIIKTKDYGTRRLYAYETPSPMFGDVGEGKISEDGQCYVWFDPIFSETIATAHYQVFLQAYGDGSCYVKERHPAYFIVSGTPGMAFGWEVKAKQRDYTQERLDPVFRKVHIENQKDYGGSAVTHLEEIQYERGLKDENSNERDSIQRCDRDKIINDIFGY